MDITQGTNYRAVFLLVGEDMNSGVTGASPSVQISRNGQPFTSTTNAAVDTGEGWYYVDLTPTETETIGPLVLRANADGAAFEWRDIHYVKPPQAEMDLEAIRQIILEELENVTVTIPIRFIRSGTNS